MLTNTMLFTYTEFPGTNAHIPGQSHELSLESLAEKLTARPNVNPGPKTAGRAFTPGRYENDSRSKGSEFYGASCFVADLDGNKHAGVTEQQLVDVLEFLKLNDLAYIMYPSYSPNCWRLILPLTRCVSDAEHEKLWQVFSAAFPLPIDDTGKTARRIHFLPQVPTQEAYDAYEPDSCLTGRLLDPDAPELRSTAAEAPETRGGIFANLKLSGVKIRSSFVYTLEDLTQLLSVTTVKQEELNRWGFKLAKEAARKCVDKEQFLTDLWAAAVAGMNENPKLVEDPEVAIRTAQRAVDQAYAEAEAEQQEAAEAIPVSVVKTVKKLIGDGDIAGAGKQLGKYVNNTLTPEVLTKEFSKDIEDDGKVVSIPDAVADFQGGIEESVRFDWQLKLALDDKGQWLGSDENVAIVLREHPECKGLFARNVRRTPQDWLLSDAPWHLPAGATSADVSAAKIAEWTRDILKCKTVGFLRAKAAYKNAINSAPEFDPAREWLHSLVWDETPRINTWLSEIAGIENTEYVQVVGRKLLLQICARTEEPGIKSDECVVFVGPQGAGKSRLVRALCPDPNWFVTVGGELSEKETAAKLLAAMVCEIEEIDKFSGKKNAAEFKAFVSESTSKHRPPYGDTLMDFPRRAVLIGTTNRPDFLHDETGARRFLPVTVSKRIDVAKLAEIRDQLFAEAMRCRAAGELHYFDDDQRERLATPEQVSLTRLDMSGEAECILDIMENCPANITYKKGEKTTAPVEDRIGILPGQLEGSRMLFITPSQAGIVLKRNEFNKDDRTVKAALRTAGLKQGRGALAGHWSRCGKL